LKCKIEWEVCLPKLCEARWCDHYTSEVIVQRYTRSVKMKHSALWH